MGDEFDFTQPQRRETKRFEPPPWEREAFEQLRRTQQADEAERVTEQSDDSGPPEVERVGAAEAQAEPVWVPATEPEAASDDGTATAAAAVVDEGEVVAMLAGLAAEEPSAQRSFSTIALVISAVMAAFGVMLMVWGVVALAGSGRSGRVGVIGGSLFFFFGIAAVVFAVWLAVRTLRQRGVL